MGELRASVRGNIVGYKQVRAQVVFQGHQHSTRLSLPLIYLLRFHNKFGILVSKLLANFHI